MEMDFAPLYEHAYVYHHIHWLQADLSVSFLQKHGASQEDLMEIQKTTSPNIHFLNIENVWPILTPQVKQALATIRYVPALRVNIAEIDEAIAHLKLFSRLSMQERTVMLDRSHPHLRSGGEYKDHLFTVKLGEQHTAFMVGLMDMTNWPAWFRLLRTLK